MRILKYGKKKIIDLELKEGINDFFLDASLHMRIVKTTSKIDSKKRRIDVHVITYFGKNSDSWRIRHCNKRYGSVENDCCFSFKKMIFDKYDGEITW